MHTLEISLFSFHSAARHGTTSHRRGTLSSASIFAATQPAWHHACRHYSPILENIHSAEGKAKTHS